MNCHTCHTFEWKGFTKSNVLLNYIRDALFYKPPLNDTHINSRLFPPYEKLTRALQIILKHPLNFKIRNNMKISSDYIIRTISMYIRNIIPPLFYNFTFSLFTFSLSLIPKIRTKFDQTWSFFLKIITFEDLPNTKVKVSPDSLRMQDNLFEFFFLDTEPVRILKSKLYCCSLDESDLF